MPNDGDSSSSEGSSQPDTRPTFLCRSATDSRRGMYYSFSWVDLLRSALENPGEWGSSDVWNVHPVDEAPEKKAPPQTPHKKRRVLKTIPEDGDGHISAGSSSDNSGDDYQHQDDGESDDNEIPEQSDVPESEVDEAEDTVPQFLFILKVRLL